MSKNPKSWLSSAGPWVPRRQKMLESVAWRARSSPLSRILDRLEIEHMRHAGTANGRLYVSFNQFEAYGVSRKDIRRALQLGEDLGLLEVIRPAGRATGPIRNPNVYRLTYLPEGNQKPTDEWARIGDNQAKNAVNKYRNAGARSRTPSSQQTRSKKTTPQSPNGTNTVPKSP